MERGRRFLSSKRISCSRVYFNNSISYSLNSPFTYTSNQSRQTCNSRMLMKFDPPHTGGKKHMNISSLDFLTHENQLSPKCFQSQTGDGGINTFEAALSSSISESAKATWVHNPARTLFFSIISTEFAQTYHLITTPPIKSQTIAKHV